ncbi:hypothetical protein MAL08_00230 [Leptospira noguchii]|uniref:Uncharacterized protein n=1 Tax=Leptospira noguchii TaxID=28182 RepID=A0AAE9K819_9LEPT|nr:hypothetical protein [Leptospira noguchii]UOG30575.1 hypothetical protein MAL06_00220 [Leptospira noguchii]UOG37854.1 hypothetical protein MAL08_00230 [Leptospira noguchii]UOG52715.1 hypothetical protein MAL09_00235 [Leptospira noguchii]UOG56700.1 hypothetical protein MAL03_00225 [Leptospira noguchii]
MLRSIVSSIEFIIRPNFLTSNSRYIVSKISTIINPQLLDLKINPSEIR